MGKMYADNKDQQVVDYKYLIGIINLEISIEEIHGNQAGVFGGINALGRLLNHLYDEKYKKDMEYIDGMKGPTVRTPDQLRQVTADLHRQKMDLKHEALIRLAYRKRLLPASATGANGGYKGGEEFD